MDKHFEAATEAEFYFQTTTGAHAYSTRQRTRKIARVEGRSLSHTFKDISKKK